MNEGREKQNNLLDTTDCLEAVGVFKGWKNFLFIIIISCLLLLQVSFWLVDIGYVKTGKAENTSPAVVAEAPKKAVETAQQPAEIQEAAKKMAAGPNQPTKAAPQQPQQPADEPAEIQQAAKKIAAGPNQPTKAAPQEPQQPADEMAEIQEAAKKIAAAPNQPAKAAPQEPQQPEPQQAEPRFGIKFTYLAWLIRFLNFVLILSAALYCLTMLFSLKVSLLGRLGGINHIARAFFLSLAFLVLLLPWQKFFGGIVAGAMYTPDELLRSSAVAGAAGIFEAILYYLRFTGYWVLVMLLLKIGRASCRERV